jgi:anti-sigma regulatory factor (Ser/Thr protein kinase)
MCVEASHSYPVDSETPGRARHFARENIDNVLGHDPRASEVVDAATLVVSELVTNAMRAGSSRTELDVKVHQGWVEVSVWDDAPGRPIPVRPSIHDERGRGLRVVDSLSDEWGTSPSGGGKRVWASLVLPEGLRDIASCSIPFSRLGS